MSLSHSTLSLGSWLQSSNAESPVVAKRLPIWICISKTVRLLWRCARHSDHIATITTDIPFGDTEAHSATETPDGFADVVRRFHVIGSHLEPFPISRFPGLRLQRSSGRLSSRTILRGNIVISHTVSQLQASGCLPHPPRP